MQILSRNKSQFYTVFPEAQKTLKEPQSNKQVWETERQVDGDKEPVDTGKPASLAMSLLWRISDYRNYNFRPQGRERQESQFEIRADESTTMLSSRQYIKGKSKLRKFLSQVLPTFVIFTIMAVGTWLLLPIVIEQGVALGRLIQEVWGK